MQERILAFAGWLEATCSAIFPLYCRQASRADWNKCAPPGGKNLRPLSSEWWSDKYNRKKEWLSLCPVFFLTNKNKTLINYLDSPHAKNWNPIWTRKEEKEFLLIRLRQIVKHFPKESNSVIICTVAVFVFGQFFQFMPVIIFITYTYVIIKTISRLIFRVEQKRKC